MNLPEEIVEFIRQGAACAGVDFPDRESNLFDTGILDSFGLVDFVSLIEESSSITVPDADIKRGNFANLRLIEEYIDRHKGS